MAPGWSLRCTVCGYEEAFGPNVMGCPACPADPYPAVLEAVFQPAAIPPALSTRHGQGLARYRDLLPMADDDEWVTLGEGATPLVRSTLIGPSLGLDQLWFKLEGANPTRSFKDRYVAVSVNVARRFGFRRLVVSSTGNLGVSTAAYGKRAGMETLVIVLPETPAAVLAQARLHGAVLAAVAPEVRQELFEAIANSPGWFPLGLFLRRPIQNPFGVEGYRSFAWEILEQLGGSPAAVIFPSARGNGLYGAYKGFVEARQWGWADDVPRMIACQPVGANSLEVSIAQGSDRAVELPRITSLAFSAAETVASDEALRAVRQSKGVAVSATEDAIREAVLLLGREGICAEPASALPVACLPILVEQGRLDPDRPIVCILTADGVRWREQLPVSGEPAELLQADSRSIADFLASNGLS